MTVNCAVKCTETVPDANYTDTNTCFTEVYISMDFRFSLSLM
jgi:hypothetical protein